MIVFVDDDCRPLPGWLAAYRTAIAEHPDCDVFEGRTTVDRPKQRLDEFSPTNETGGFWWTCNLGISRAFFDRLGGFDESFSGAAMEDVDFRERARACGVRVAWVPDAAVVHPWRRAATFRDWRRTWVGRREFEARHPGDADWRHPAYHLRGVYQELRAVMLAVRSGQLAGLRHPLGRAILLTLDAVTCRWSSPTAREEAG